AVFAHHPGEPHSGGPDRPEGWTYLCLYVPEDLFKRLTSSERLPFFGDDVFDDPILADSFRRFQQSLLVPCSRLRRESSLIEALSWLQRHHGERQTAPSVGREPISVRRAREFLDANLAEDVSTSALSRA